MKRWLRCESLGVFVLGVSERVLVEVVLVGGRMWGKNHLRENKHTSKMTKLDKGFLLVPFKWLTFAETKQHHI